MKKRVLWTFLSLVVLSAEVNAYWSVLPRGGWRFAGPRDEEIRSKKDESIFQVAMTKHFVISCSAPDPEVAERIADHLEVWFSQIVGLLPGF